VLDYVVEKYFFKPIVWKGPRITIQVVDNVRLSIRNYIQINGIGKMLEAAS